ncbi:hypothetical protein ZOSMA_461G00010 [Zostera marina]|uniref:Uncharacterized protein n=1 Tax=Zostera marina TaxID=29655 RepID=A0A0K9P2L1_ZOSMR|nr:hypothetical protein ZOSMA_461G00010 [Zostera marina]
MQKTKIKLTFLTSTVLTIRLLEPRPGSSSSELFRLAPSRISNQQSPIIPHQNILNLLLLLFVNVLLKESNQSLGDALTNSVDPRCLSSTANTDPHINTTKAMATEEEDRFEGLVSEDLWFHQLNGNAVDLNQATPAFAMSDCHGSLLTTEALHGFIHCFRRHHRHCRRCDEAQTLNSIISKQHHVVFINDILQKIPKSI